MKFADLFISSVVGKRQYEAAKTHKPFSEYVSKSDEAFALFIF